MKKQIMMFAALVLVSATALFAQESTPEPAAGAQAEATAEATAEASATVEQTLSELFAGLPQERLDDGGFVVGEPDAPITIIEFMDFACVHCQNYRPVIEQVIVDYVASGMAKYELRIFPTAGREQTYLVGKLLECAEEQRAGAFWQSYELMYSYANVGSYNGNVPNKLAQALDLDYGDLVACTDSAEQVDVDIALGSELGVSGTPGVRVRYDDGDAQTITVDGAELTRGGLPYELLAQLIHEANGIDFEVTPLPMPAGGDVI